MKNEVHLIENFVSWQGEGPDSGRPMVILRFKYCDRNCKFCDTQVKMRVSAEAAYSLDDIQEIIDYKNVGILVTGGEPTIPKHFDEALSLLTDLKYPVANVESNGFNLEGLIKSTPTDKPVRFMYSPKIFSFDDASKEIIKLEKLKKYDNVFIKVVYDNSEETSYFLDQLGAEDELIEQHRIWVMPEGVTINELIKNSEKVFDVCEEYNFCFSSRNHIIFGFI